MRDLLRTLWRLFGLLGAILSLRRWWRTVTDDEVRREERILAGALLVAMVGLIIWSLAAGFAHQPAAEPVTAFGPTAPAPAADQILVNFVDHASETEIAALADRYGLALTYNSPHSVDDRLMLTDANALGPRDRQTLLARLNREPLVECAEENFYVSIFGVPAATPVAMSTPSAVPNDPRYGEQWNFAMIGMPEAWDKADGTGVVVAVIDTGVAFEREAGLPVASDLVGTKWTKPYDFTTNRAKAYDDHGHGTHVAGTIAQTTNNGHGVAGIAHQATIMPLKVLTGQGYGNVSDIADAIRYAADNGAQVINMSLGGPRSSREMSLACTYANQRGVTIVCAAGNSGSEGVSYPAAYPECIAVSSVGPTGDLAFYSSWGKQVALAAPGGAYRRPEDRHDGILQNTIFNKQDVFEAWQGTSMASPHVAGVAALLIQLGRTGPEAVRAQLCRTATPKDDQLRYGAGVLNAAAAVGGLTEPSPNQLAAPATRFHRLGLPLAGLAAALLALCSVAGPRRSVAVVAALLVVGVLDAVTANSNALGNLFGCALWPFGALLVLFGIQPLRPGLAGGLLGFAVGCLMLGLTGQASLIWMLVNALVAAILAVLTGRAR